MHVDLLEADLGKLCIWRPKEVLYRYANKDDYWSLLCYLRLFFFKWMLYFTTRMFLLYFCMILGNLIVSFQPKYFKNMLKLKNLDI